MMVGFFSCAYCGQKTCVCDGESGFRLSWMKRRNPISDLNEGESDMLCVQSVGGGHVLVTANLVFDGWEQAHGPQLCYGFKICAFFQVVGGGRAPMTTNRCGRLYWVKLEGINPMPAELCSTDDK